VCKKFHQGQTAVSCDKHACAGTARQLEFWPKKGAIFWPLIRLSLCRNCDKIRVSVPKMGPPGGPLFGTGRQQPQARKSTRSGGRVFWRAQGPSVLGPAVAGAFRGRNDLSADCFDGGSVAPTWCCGLLAFRSPLVPCCFFWSSCIFAKCFKTNAVVGATPFRSF